MRVEHPNAGEDDGVPPAQVDVDGDSVPVDEDGTFEVSDSARDWLRRFADAYGVDPGDIRQEDGPPDDEITVDEVEAIADDVIESRMDDGECPWCDEYSGDAVGQHAASAHPDAWDDYKEA